MRRALSLLARNIPGRAWISARLTSFYLFLVLPRTALFDQEYYEAQRGTVFGSRRAALRDFVRSARTFAYSPNPLFEPQWFAGAPTDIAVRYVLSYLRSGPGPRDCGPMFDSRAYLAREPGAAGHPGRALGHFLETATPETIVPVPAGFPGSAPSWGDARSRLLSLASDLSRGARLVAQPAPTRMLPESARRSSEPAAGAPLVTVVLPVRNRSSSVGRAVESVRAQSYGRWELLVVDDGSTDSTGETLASLASADERIRVLPGPSRGVAAARNAGLVSASGSLIAFLDSDYALEPDHLATMVSALGSGEAVAAATEALADVGTIRLAGVPSLGSLLLGAAVDLNGVVVRRAVLEELGGFDESLPRWCHLDLMIRLATRAEVPAVDHLGARGFRVDADVEQLEATESDHWLWVVLARHMMSWSDVRDRLAERVPGRVSISMPTYGDWRMTIRAVRAVLEHSAEHDIEVVVVDNGSERSVSAILTSAFLGDPRVRVVPLARNFNFGIGSNVGMAVSTGDPVMFLNNDTEVLDGWLDGLERRLDDPTVRGAQPLLLYPDGTIQSAGSFLPGGNVPPIALLAGLPPEDARRTDVLHLRIVTAAAFMVRAREFVELEGFDPFFVNGQEDVDYCLRATERFGGGFDVVTGATVIHHESKTPGRSTRIQGNRQILVDRWRGRLAADDPRVLDPIGLRIAHWDVPATEPDSDDIRIPLPVYVRDRTRVESGPAAGLPSLRWALKLAAHPGPRGDGWGDVHFGASLARALERLGQQVVVDRRESFERPTSSLDDVVLVIRGLENVTAQPGRVNLLWVISHPDLVTDREFQSFDTVFAASITWAERMTASGRRVLPLLQATDPEQFHPGLARPDLAVPVLFVGRSRNILRPVVRDAVEAGLDLAIYGDGWDQFGLGSHVRAEYLPYDEVGAAYASAGVVLNDHWADMAREGFLSNRIFDAVAAGGRVVTDPVEGLGDLFGGAVQSYRDVDDLALLCSEAGRGRFPSDDERRGIAERVAAEHSFDARARQLLDAALEVRAEQGWAADDRAPA